jgi:16S rRNA (cytidine1402-2'-O)-methyltransferase
MSGTLYLVATPIGNLEDITLRALRVLKEADLIACEDTRHTRKLLTHYRISKPLISYHEHNERERTRELIAKIETGANVALVSDAGLPLLSDPGFDLVQEAIRRRIQVAPVPGASAMTAALVASGLPVSQFIFAGFLPPRRTARRAKLSELAAVRSTIILYESPHRIKTTIEDAITELGDRNAVLARELTKIHEEFKRGRLSDLMSEMEIGPVKGEMVLLIGPPTDRPRAESRHSVFEEVNSLIALDELTPREAIKRIARERGISGSQAYRIYIQEKETAEEPGDNE